MFENKYIHSKFWQWFDRKILTSTSGQITLFILVMLFIVFSGGLLFYLTAPSGSDAIRHPLLWSLLHATDSGYIINNKGFYPVLVAFYVTVAGWVLMGAVLLTITTSAYQRRIDSIISGFARYPLAENHTVIIGWGNMGPAIVSQLYSETKSNVVILSSTHPDQVYKDMGNAPSSIPENLYDKIIVYNGSIDSEHEIRALNLLKTTKVIVIGNENDTNNDSRCIQSTMVLLSCLNKLNEMNSSKDISLSCYMHISDIKTFNLLKNITRAFKQDTNSVNILMFNFYESWARRLWSIPLHPVGKNSSSYPPLLYSSSSFNNNGAVHLVILGFDSMGQALAVQAARIAHYCNFDGIKSQITIIDSNAESMKRKLLLYMNIEELPDIKFVFKDIAPDDASVKDILLKAASDKAKPLTVAVCLSNPDEAMSLSFSLHVVVNNPDIPILVRQQTAFGLNSMTKIMKWNNIIPFGMLNECYGTEKYHEKLAEIIHEHYLTQAKISGDYNPELSNYSTWDNLPATYRWSNRYQADAFIERMRAAGYDFLPSSAGFPPEEFSVEFLEMISEAEHRRWWAEKLLAGWTLGERDDKKRHHPDLIPYSQLSEKTKDYDRSAMQHLPALLANSANIMLHKDRD